MFQLAANGQRFCIEGLVSAIDVRISESLDRSQIDVTLHNIGLLGQQKGSN
jgi:hypothetical protein